jgi:flagellar motility protein MotE (MotC chaperone)
MKDKENIKPKSDGHSPIEAIRSIIFGDQEKTLNQKLDEIGKNLHNLSLELADKLNELQHQQDKDRKQFSQKIAKIQTIIEDNAKSTEEKLKLVDSTIRHGQNELDSKKLNRTALADQLETLVNYLRNNK